MKYFEVLPSVFVKGFCIISAKPQPIYQLSLGTRTWKLQTVSFQAVIAFNSSTDKFVYYFSQIYFDPFQVTFTDATEVVQQILQDEKRLDNFLLELEQDLLTDDKINTLNNLS